MGRALHGRDADLALLDETLASARGGRGRALFLTGEPGIGKSTLLAEARARAGDARVLAGAAWESGGAPPYWPWQQVLRDAGISWETLAPVAVQDPAAARFGLLDAVVRALLALAAERPVVILLDDLHAADLPSLDLLVMLVRELPRASIALVAAWREAELAVRTEAAQRLARATRFGDVQPLRHLTLDELTAWVGADAQAIYATTEGNPLFVEETLRARRGGVPRGLNSVISDHLALASDATRDVLAVAAVVGREIDRALLATHASPDAIDAALTEAVSLGIVDSTERGWRFRHVLFRDALYTALPAARKAELHRSIGDSLARTDPVRAAHHLLAVRAPNAVEAARIAADHATAVYAFEDAAELLAAALRTVDERTPLAIDLRIELATARYHVGLIDAAQADCVRAAELARNVGDIERLARAALVYALDLKSGGRDPMMIALLDEAARGLPADDNPSRARVLARLAAGLVPGAAPDVIRAQELAREAVAIARRLADKPTLMFVLRYAGHAHSYQIHLREAQAIATEVIALSDELGCPLEAVDQRAFQVCTYLAFGDLAASQAALHSFLALLAPLPQPQYRWRIPIVRAFDAMRRGDFAEAARHTAIAQDIAREYNLDRAGWAARFADLAIVAATRDRERARVYLAETREKLATRIAAGSANFIALVAAIAEAPGARAELARATFFPTLIVLHFAGEAVLLLDDRPQAERLLPVLRQQCALYPLVNGPQGGVFVRPSAQVLGEIEALLGHVDEGIAHLEAGLAHARTIESPPAIAHGAAALARVLERRGRPADRDRVHSLRTEAASLARLCELHGIDAAPPPSRPDRLALVCAAEGVHVHWNGREIRVPTTKGLEFLAALVAAPGREIHVSDLIGDDDRGDAGEVFDAKARASYKARAEELQAELEEARARNDLGRAEKLAAELEAVTDELLAGTGLGGRTRKAGSRVERARVNVQRRLKDAIKRLGTEDAALGRYLDATVRTGTFCSFVPLDT